MQHYNTSAGTPGICAQAAPIALARSTRALIALWHVASKHALPRIMHDVTAHLGSSQVDAQSGHIPVGTGRALAAGPGKGRILNPPAVWTLALVAGPAAVWATVAAACRRAALTAAVVAAVIASAAASVNAAVSAMRAAALLATRAASAYRPMMSSLHLLDTSSHLLSDTEDEFA